MAEAGDLISEFKNAKPPEKMLFIGGAVLVVVIILYVHNQQSGGGQASQANLPSAGGTDTGGGGGGIQTVPTGQQGQVPLLPSGFVPIFDAAGNLIGYQPTQTTGTPGGPPLPPSPTPSPKHGGHDKGSHGHNQSPSGAKHEQNLTRGGLRGEGRQDIAQGRKDIRQAGHLTGRQTLSNKTNTSTARGGNLWPANNAATRGGLVQHNPIPMQRPQRANPSLQRSTVTRTAASARLRG